jgi:hypothetical protein
MYPHRIRLRGPWECEPLARRGDSANEPLPPPRRVDVPCRWDDAGLPSFAGRVRFCRRFGNPGRIDAHERVWLTFAEIAGAAEVRLNDHVLGRRSGSPGEAEFDATELLQARNELVVDVEGTAAEAGLWGEVALEVRCTAFLRGLRRYAIFSKDRPELRVTGQVVGVAERPLELYIVVDRSVAAYRVVTAAPEGRDFEIVVPDVALGKGRESGDPVVQVDLVNGATVWYTSVAEVTFQPVSGEGE